MIISRLPGRYFHQKASAFIYFIFFAQVSDFGFLAGIAFAFSRQF